MSRPPGITDVVTPRERARRHIDEGSVIAGYSVEEERADDLAELLGAFPECPDGAEKSTM